MDIKYIPGDLVTIETESTKPRVLKVSNVDKNRVIYCEGWGKIYYYDEIKPVRITPEILKKNGWKKVENEPYGKGRIEIEQCNENEFMYCKGDLKVVFLYVHSLQHFLFGLGINHEMEV